MNTTQLHELLYQSYETELGGIQIYTKAIQCAVNEDLAEEWAEYLEQTQKHASIMRSVLNDLGLDVDLQTPGREVCRHTGESLIRAMELAQASGERASAELVAAECVSLAETKDHLNWELIGECAKKATGETKKILTAAYEEVEDEEDEHLYHTKGWCRELWIQNLGMPAVLPPPEEEKHVKTAIGAEKAKNARTDLL